MENYRNEILSEISKLKKKSEQNPLVILETIKSCDYGDLFHSKIKEKFKPDHYEYQAFIDELYKEYIDLLFDVFDKDKSDSALTLRKNIREFALSFTKERWKCHILSRLADVTSFEFLLDKCKDVLQTETDAHVDKAPIVALAGLYRHERFKKQIGDFFRNAYEYARLYGLITKKYDYLKDNFNTAIYLVISLGIISMDSTDREEFADIYFDAYRFATLKDRGYSMYQVSGYMAVYLTMFTKKFKTNVLDYSISITGEHYQDNKFVFQTRYAKWYLENDCSSALSFLKSNKCYAELGYIAALLADLNCGNALPVLQNKIKEIDNPVTVEVFLEAISRLKSQNEKPELENRMIWMFESSSAGQRALGEVSDNVFLKRAKSKVKIDDNVYETDEE